MSEPKPFVNYGANQKIVVLLGWAGAADKNVAKYAQVYQKKGYTTVQFTAKPCIKGWGAKNGRDVSQLAQTLSLLLPNRWIFHVFSMNGFHSLVSLDCQFPNLKVLERCDGLFLDSCPVFYKFSMDSMRKHALVMDHIYLNDIKNSTFIRSQVYCLCKKFETTRFAWRILKNQMMVATGICTIEEASAFHYLLNHPHLPQVICSVFSDADLVCSAEQITVFNEAASKRSDVTVLRFQDSAHVEHFKKHSKLYLENMDSFLKTVENLNRNLISKL